MSPKEINDSLVQLFSDEGLLVNGFKIKAKSPFVANIEHEDNLTVISFGANQLKAEVTKIITIYAYIEQVVFGKTGGSIKLRNFPDFSFSYETFGSKCCDYPGGKSCFKHNIRSVCQDIESEICAKYEGQNTYKEVAKKCLQYAEEWTTICHDSGVKFNNSDYIDRYTLSSQCYDFVKQNVEEDVEKRYGSVILTWLFMYVVLPMIIKWVVNRVLERLFND
jgi:hypothetical protein